MMVMMATMVNDEVDDGSDQGSLATTLMLIARIMKVMMATIATMTRTTMCDH